MATVTYHKIYRHHSQTNDYKIGDVKYSEWIIAGLDDDRRPYLDIAAFEAESNISMGYRRLLAGDKIEFITHYGNVGNPYVHKSDWEEDEWTTVTITDISLETEFIIFDMPDRKGVCKLFHVVPRSFNFPFMRPIKQNRGMQTILDMMQPVKDRESTT